MIEAAWEEQSARQEAEQAARDAARKRLMDEVTAAQVEQMRQHQLARRVGSAAWGPDGGLTLVWRLLPCHVWVAAQALLLSGRPGEGQMLAEAH